MAKPVYALVGSDSFLQLQELAKLRAQLPADVQASEIDGENGQLADVLDELRSFAMFGSGKLVVVRSADEFISRFREQLESYLSHPSDSSTLVLRCNSLPKTQRIAKQIDKIGQVIDCAPPKERELPQWILAHAKVAHGATIDRHAAELLADFIGADLSRLDNELAKLALQVDGHQIGPDDITGSVVYQREREMWTLTDELSAGRPTDALKRWRQLLQTDTSAEFRGVTWLTIWLEKLARASGMRRAGRRPFDIARELRIWPATQVDSLLTLADKLGTRGIASLLDLLAELDRNTKTGLGDGKTNVERFILHVANVAAARPVRATQKA